MTIQHEEVQNNLRLPFYFSSGGNVQVPEHWHQGIELNYLMKGKDLRFAIDGHTYHFYPDDMWAVNRRQIHSASGEKNQKWYYFGIIIDDDYLISQFPSSKNWHLHLLGKKSTSNKQAYQQICQEMLALNRLMQNKIDDDNRFLLLSHLMRIIVFLDLYFNQKEETQLNIAMLIKAITSKNYLLMFLSTLILKRIKLSTTKAAVTIKTIL